MLLLLPAVPAECEAVLHRGAAQCSLLLAQWGAAGGVSVRHAGAALGSRDGAGSYGAYHGERQQGAVTNLVAVAATAWSTMLQLELLKC